MLAALVAPGLLALAAFAAIACGVGGGSGPGSRPDAGLVEVFKSEGVLWIRSERERYRPEARPLSERDRQVLEAYFPDRVLDRAKVLVVRGFDNPGFFSVFDQRGEPYPIDLRRASALALVDTVLIAMSASEGSMRDRLLFHEMVHLVQYEVLGLEEYMEGYVDSWAKNGRRYRAIPHEQQAFELAARFARSRGEPFSVESEVRSRFDVASGTASKLGFEELR
jgi:hypothetical protein